MGAMRKIFYKIIRALGYHQRFFWTGLWLCIGFIVILIPVFCADTGKISLPPAILWAFACLVSGILVGFIFGVPTIINSGLTATPQNNIAQAAMKPAVAQKLVEANTNLTQVSDWLTKVIIGAGLVQLRQVPGFVLYIATKIGKGVAISQSTSLPYATVFAGGIIIAFTVYGFIFGYLIMRIVLTEIFGDS